MANSAAGDGTMVPGAGGGIGIQSFAVSYPSVVRTNEYFRQRNPSLVERFERRQVDWLFSQQDSTLNADSYDREMEQFASDPFRGAVERRVLAPWETALSLEISAATTALSAADLTPADIDLMIVCSFLPDQIGLGNATYLAREIGVSAPAWNIESACAGGLVALQNAAALIAAGCYEKVLVVISCTYSRIVDETSVLSWFMGDGAGACVVGRVPHGSGILGFNTISAAALCDAFRIEQVINAGGQPGLELKSSPAAGGAVRDFIGSALRDCCEGAAKEAGVTIADIDLFVFSTAQAWLPAYSARILGIDDSRTINTFPIYGNIGPALITANLYHAAQSGKIRDGDLVLLFAVGAAGTAGAIVIRWGDVALGPPPPPSSKLIRQ